MRDHTPTLFSAPCWTDQWPVGSLLRRHVSGDAVGEVVEVCEGRIVVEWRDHPRWGTYRCSHGSDLGLEAVGS